MTQRILLINPNCNEDCTAGMDAAMAPLRLPGGPRIDVVTLKKGPPGVYSDLDYNMVAGPLCQLIEAEDAATAAFVIGCFSDPGLHAARGITTKPVFGIQESAIAAALTLGDRFAIIAIMDASIRRHARAIRAMGVEARLAGELALNLSIEALREEDETYRRMLETGRRLREEAGADVVIMGCAGMARYRERLQAELGLPVIEPCQAAVTQAIGAVRIGYSAARGAAVAAAAE